ncbi:hypothetical protein DFH28DRAFT_240175 [Melampsora americana]|nr:hypothetical protein DFH28DRAFT_240175 [Melampsora americana]
MNSTFSRDLTAFSALNCIRLSQFQVIRDTSALQLETHLAYTDSLLQSQATNSMRPLQYKEKEKVWQMAYESIHVPRISQTKALVSYCIISTTIRSGTWLTTFTLIVSNKSDLTDSVQVPSGSLLDHQRPWQRKKRILPEDDQTDIPQDLEKRVESVMRLQVEYSIHLVCIHYGCSKEVIYRKMTDKIQTGSPWTCFLLKMNFIHPSNETFFHLKE